MTGTIPTDLSDIKVSLARIEGQTTALQKADEVAQLAAEHRHRNVMQTIETFVPRRELDIKFAECSTRAEGLSKRIDDIEGDRKKIHWAIASSAFSAIVGIGGFILKKLGMLGF